LTARIAALYPGLGLTHAARVVDVIFDEISEALCRGDQVQLRGFASFTVRSRPAHVARNPRTGEAVSVGERYVPRCRAGKDLRQLLNPND